MQKLCKYCKLNLEFKNSQQFGAHLRNCSLRPDASILNPKNSTSHIKRSKHFIYCKKCGVEYSLNLTDNEFNKGLYRKHCFINCNYKYKHCSTAYVSRHKEKLKCWFCNQELIKSKKFCSKKCELNYKYKENLKKWFSGELIGNRGETPKVFVRRYLFEKYNRSCALCGWSKINPHTNKIPLNIHHINGDYRDTIEENVILLCPNCHSLTKNYGSRNKGNGRLKRRQWRSWRNLKVE